MEIWKISPLCFDHVEVSNFGRIRIKDRKVTYVQNGKEFEQTRKGKIVSPWIGHNGYLIIAIKKDGSRPKFLVHRLVASAFCENFDPNITVNHIDGNKTNNHWTNLEWISRSENTRKQWVDRLVDIRGEKHPSCKLLDREVFEIRERFAAGERPASIAKDFPKVSPSLIYMICQGRKRLSSLSPSCRLI